ncbi:sap protein [Fusarium austroafricanum]|uniref:Sap protein n=1 Tax=Fusarium austroafricanum TaxID=2364996 RepID=A0A8H4K760_9HYPO|nr:sap protein [Fusarium austroafricanum]
MADWAKLKVVDLKAELKSRGLPQHGLKTELVARLREADKDTSATEAQDEPKDTPMTNESAGDELPTEDPVAADKELYEATEKPETTEEKSEKNIVDKEKNETGDNIAPGADVETSKGGDETEKEEVTKNATPEEVSQDTDTIADVPIPGNEVDHQSREPTAEEKSRAGTVTTTVESSPSHSLEPTPAAERQKRKRRSLTPPPTEESIARKRARADETPTNGDNLGARQEDLLPKSQNEPALTNIDSEPQTEKPRQSPPQDPASESKTPREENSEEDSSKQQEMDFERDVAPAVHPATPALYIKNFMRPLRPQDVKAHLVELATHSRDVVNDEIVTEFFLDQIRTHGFVIFKTTAAAARVRTALHDSVWPNESNRKALWVDFVPPEKVHDWIDTEQASGGPRGRSGVRWEIVYENGSGGDVVAHLEEATAASSRAGTQLGAVQPPIAAMTTNSIPLGPRALRDPAIPTGPRPVRPGTGPGPRPPPINPGGTFKRTNTRPVISYQPVSEDLARRRIESMRSYYSNDRDRDLGREINRYSFENGASFVDRGKEVFEGIRPPHRERGMGRDRRSGRRRGRGGGGGRPRSDRYLPPPRNDRPPRRGSLSDDGDARMRD